MLLIANTTSWKRQQSRTSQALGDGCFHPSKWRQRRTSLCEVKTCLFTPKLPVSMPRRQCSSKFVRSMEIHRLKWRSKINYRRSNCYQEPLSYTQPLYNLYTQVIQVIHTSRTSYTHKSYKLYIQVIHTSRTSYTHKSYKLYTQVIQVIHTSHSSYTHKSYK